MFQDSRINKVLYGGDYNPEQWPEEIWEEDMRLFKLAGSGGGKWAEGFPCHLYSGSSGVDGETPPRYFAHRV